MGKISQTIAIYDQRMNSIIDSDAKLEKLAVGAKHSEGPVYFTQSDSVVFSDVTFEQVVSPKGYTSGYSK